MKKTQKPQRVPMAETVRLTSRALVVVASFYDRILEVGLHHQP